MAREFQNFGVRFAYPENWVLEELDVEDAQGISVVSPGGAFWSLTIHPAGTAVERLLQAVIEELRREYENSDVEAATDTLAGEAIQGYEIHFYCLDLTNTAQIRGFETLDASYVMLWQAEDREYEQVEPVFRAIATSLVQSAREGLEEE